MVRQAGHGKEKESSFKIKIVRDSTGERDASSSLIFKKNFF